MSIAQTWFGRSTASLRSRYGQILWPGAGLDVLGRRYNASMPIRRITVATASRPIITPPRRSISRSIRLPAKG